MCRVWIDEFCLRPRTKIGRGHWYLYYAVVWCLLLSVARQCAPYSSPALVDQSRGTTWGQQVTTHYVGKLLHTKLDTHTNQTKDGEEKHAWVSLFPSLAVFSLHVNKLRLAM